MGCPSFQEGLVVVFFIVLIFGSSRLPQLGSGLGRFFRNLKDSATGQDEIDVTDRSQVTDGSEPSDASDPESKSEPDRNRA